MTSKTRSVAPRHEGGLGCQVLAGLISGETTFPMAEGPIPKTASRRYNIAVLSSKFEHETTPKHQRHAVYASETSGLLLIALVLLVLTLVRYWHEIHWSLR